MPFLVYAFCIPFPLIALVCLWIGDWALAMMPLITFVLIPLAELKLVGNTMNRSPLAQASAASKQQYDRLIYTMVALHVSLVCMMVVMAANGHFSGWEWLGAIATVGICCGTFGINIGHELGHRNNKLDQSLAKVMLLTSLYMHFIIEHNRGHHAHVATDADPASAKKGQMLYDFWLRSVVMGWVSAWKIENRRLRKFSYPYARLQNEMLRFQLIQLGVLATIYMLAGLAPMLAFMAAAALGALLLETVNYVEHYGLRRAKKANGRYERVQPKHSWNSNHALGRALMFELPRHSDHHANPGRHYSVLRHFDDSPQLPAGYPAMILLATIPPLWFRVMHKHLGVEQERLHKLAA